MRFVLPIAAALLLAACVRAPEQPEPIPQAPTPKPSVPGSLVGLSAGELIQRMGPPALQVREGAGLKLQWRGRTCVLDAYLYLQGSAERVAHVDTRLQNGNDTPQQACVASLTRS
jgi:hypothetical protein